MKRKRRTKWLQSEDLERLLLFAEEAESLLPVLIALAGAGIGGGQGVCAAGGGSAVAAGGHVGAVGWRGAGDRLDPRIHLLLGVKHGD